MANLGSGTIANAKGLHIEALAGTNTWGIHQEGSNDLNHFEGEAKLGGILNLPITDLGADPTTTELPNDGDVGLFRNTLSGNHYLAWNDSGSIKKVTGT